MHDANRAVPKFVPGVAYGFASAGIAASACVIDDAGLHRSRSSSAGLSSIGAAAWLARRVLDRLNARHGIRKRFSPDSLRWLATHSLPVNVRDFSNLVRRAFILADDELDLRTAMRVPKTAAVTTLCEPMAQGMAQGAD